MDAPKYFKHGKWKDELNSDQKEKLQNELLKKNKSGKTLWETLVDHWNRSQEGSKNKVNINNMPDYTNIVGSIK